ELVSEADPIIENIPTKRPPQPLPLLFTTTTTTPSPNRAHVSSSTSDIPNAPSPVNRTHGSSGRAAFAAAAYGSPTPSVPIAEPMNRFVPGRWAFDIAMPHTTLSPPS